MTSHLSLAATAAGAPTSPSTPTATPRPASTVICSRARPDSTSSTSQPCSRLGKIVTRWGARAVLASQNSSSALAVRSLRVPSSATSRAVVSAIWGHEARSTPSHPNKARLRCACYSRSSRENLRGQMESMETTMVKLICTEPIRLEACSSLSRYPVASQTRLTIWALAPSTVDSCRMPVKVSGIGRLSKTRWRRRVQILSLFRIARRRTR